MTFQLENSTIRSAKTSTFDSDKFKLDSLFIPTQFFSGAPQSSKSGKKLEISRNFRELVFLKLDFFNCSFSRYSTAVQKYNYHLSIMWGSDTFFYSAHLFWNREKILYEIDRASKLPPIDLKLFELPVVCL